MSKGIIMTLKEYHYNFVYGDFSRDQIGIDCFIVVNIFINNTHIGVYVWFYNM